MKQDITHGLGVSRTQTEHLSLKNAALHACLSQLKISTTKSWRVFTTKS